MSSFDEPSASSPYGWTAIGAPESCSYLNHAVLAALSRHGSPDMAKRILDVGCGNGAFLAWMSEQGWTGTGIEPSSDGCCRARERGLHIIQGSVYDADILERIPCGAPYVVSMEVVEHLYFPSRWALLIRQVLLPGGIAIVTTPYHGYLKNLALALSGRLDAHFHALWEHGHIKFFSIATLTALVEEAGLEVVTVQRIGRIPPLAKSMLFVLRRPK